MLLGGPWLRDAKVTHDWGNNVIIVEGNGTVETISISKKLGVETRSLNYLFVMTLWKV
jgi:hypothetical protein